MHFNELTIVCPAKYRDFIAETLVLDVYRSRDFLKEKYVVLDLGANIGTFSLVASKKVGVEGLVIAVEPNPEDYKVLLKNIRINNCKNILAINLGVAGKKGRETITFHDKTFSFDVVTLNDVLGKLGVNRSVEFAKIDIEGFEVDVLQNSIDILRHTKVISIECHGTKSMIDKILGGHGFRYENITMRKLYRNCFRSFTMDPLNCFKICVIQLLAKPNAVYSAIRGLEITKKELTVGSYVNSSR